MNLIVLFCFCVCLHQVHCEYLLIRLHDTSSADLQEQQNNNSEESDIEDDDGREKKKYHHKAKGFKTMNMGGNATGAQQFPEVQSNVPFEICNPATSEYFQNIKVNINPYPLTVISGRTVKISASIDLKKPIEAGFKVTVALKKKIFAFDMDVPCMNVGMPIMIGSCKYEVTNIVPALKFCPEHCPPGQEATLPLNPGHYQGPSREMKVPNIPGMMATFVAGTINALVKVQNSSGKEIACFRSAINLKT